MKRRILVILACAVICSLLSCSKTTISPDSEIDLATLPEDSSRYRINDYNYKLIEITTNGEISGFKHYYEFSSRGVVFYSGIHEGVEPEITDIGNGIVRLELPCGSNCKNIQYFDTDNGSISELFFVASEFADYTSGDGSRILAYFIVDEASKEPVLIIQDIFTTEIIARIERSFVSVYTGANFMVFLNSSELYIDCDIVTGATAYEYINEGKGDIVVIREIVAF